MGWRRNNKDGSKRKGDRNHGKSLGTREYTRRAQMDMGQRK